MIAVLVVSDLEGDLYGVYDTQDFATNDDFKLYWTRDQAVVQSLLDFDSL